MSGQNEPGCEYVIRAHQLCMELNSILMLINSTHDVDQILHQVVEESCKALGCESARIAMREGANWVIRFVNKLPEDLIGRSFTDRELPLAALVRATGKPIAIEDAFNDDRANIESMKALGTRSVLVLPLLVNGVVTGTLLFGYHAAPVAFSASEIDYAERVASGVCIALQNARMYQDLQRTTAEIEERESRLKEAEKLGKFGYFHYDINTRKTTWSEGMFHIFGRDRLLGAPSLEEFFALYTVDPGKEELLGFLEKKEASEFDVTVKREDNLFNLHVTIRSLEDDHGNVLDRFGTVQDITERKRAEEVLRFSEARYRALYSHNPAMLATVDANLTMLSVNPICAGQLGYTANELEGKSILMIFHEDDRSAVAGQLRNCLQNPNQVHRWQYRKVRKDGHPVWVDEVAQAVYDLKGALNVLVACQDVTERKRTEEERVRLLMQLEAVLNSINEGVVISDLEGNIVMMNKEALALSEFESIEQAHRPLSQYQELFELLAPDGRPVPFEEWPLARALRGERFVDYEVRVRRKDSGKSWIFTTTGTPVFNPAGETILAVTTMHDITDRKRMEEQVERLNADLAERAGELEAANTELEAFNYTVAHDLRKPLTIINGYCQILIAGCGDKLDAQCRGYLQAAHDGTGQMNRLIGALLEFSQVAHAEPKREPVDLSGLCEEAAADLKKAEPERQVIFRIPGGIVAETDAELLRAVIGNLFGNAWKYTGNREEALIEFGAAEIDGRRTYFVRDNGIGFDPAEAGNLFAPFQRLKRGAEVGGLGIGLATVDRIVKRHGGKVWAEGEPDNGATFYFTLAEG